MEGPGTVIARGFEIVGAILGIARIKFTDGTIRIAEIHWFEAHGIGRKEHKIKRILS